MQALSYNVPNGFFGWVSVGRLAFDITAMASIYLSQHEMTFYLCVELFCMGATTIHQTIIDLMTNCQKCTVTNNRLLFTTCSAYKNVVMAELSTPASYSFSL